MNGRNVHIWERIGARPALTKRRASHSLIFFNRNKQ